MCIYKWIGPPGALGGEGRTESSNDKDFLDAPRTICAIKLSMITLLPEHPDEIKYQTDHDTDQYPGCDGNIDAEPGPFYPDISWELPQPGDTGPEVEQGTDEQKNGAEENENCTHILHARVYSGKNAKRQDTRHSRQPDILFCRSLPEPGDRHHVLLDLAPLHLPVINTGEKHPYI